MWADRLSTASRRELVTRLRAILPPPRPESPETAPFACDLDPPALAERLWPDPGFAWLDRPREQWLACDPVARLSVTAGAATVRGPGGVFETNVHAFDLVEAALEAWGPAPGAVLCGYLGYELGAELEDLEHQEGRHPDPPDLLLGLYDWRYEWSRQGWQCCGTRAWRSPKTSLPAAGSACASAVAGRRPELTQTPDHIFRASVARTVSRIHQGELFQVNLCRRLEAALPSCEIWPFYLRLRAASPASQGALLRTGEHGAVLSVSPELFLSVRKGEVRSCPIKGTRPRGATPEEDRALADALQSSEKDAAELAMIVDVTRNDLGRVCRPGSVVVTRHAALTSLPTVHHTVSEVFGRLRQDCGPAELLRASFPPASITGAPKIRAMEIAALEEGYRRGPCMGSIGWISLDGDLELSVAIRTAVAAGGRVRYLAGCGITAESDPEAELAESQTKALAFLRALDVPPDSSTPDSLTPSKI